jgi:hypothetical protein
MPTKRVSIASNDFESPTASKSRGKDGDKEKETFGCPFPGCGQVSIISYMRVSR